ncbi:MAG: O-acetyl-ADP-ribose deacetylase [Bryobacteraceae bacterium]
MERIRLLQGDITKIAVDAIVNAANSGLRGGGGVDGAIHRAGGLAIIHELDQIRPVNGLPTGQAIATTAGNLPAKFVFHAVGPIWSGGDEGEAELLASCYRTCLELAEERGVKTISFPSISTGIYGYPVTDAARVAVAAIKQYFEQTPHSTIREVLLVLFDETTFKAYAEANG